MAREIVYLRGRTEEHAELIKLLHSHGCSITVVRQFEQLLRLVREHAVTGVIIDASSDNAEVGERLVELMAAPELAQLLVVFIGKRVRERAQIAQPQFPKILLLDYPFDPQELFNLMEAAAKGIVPAPIAPPPAPAAEAPLPRTGYGGTILRLGESLGAFDDESLIPRGSPAPEAVKSALDQMTRENPKLATHARRTSLLASAVGTRCGFSEEQDRAIRTGALLLNLPFVESKLEPPSLVTLAGGRNAEVEELGRTYLAAAQLILERVGDNAAAETVRAVADLLRNRTDGMDSAIRASAEALLLTELADQVCWKTGSWQLNSARLATSAIRETPFVQNPQLRAAAARVIAEAIAQDPPRSPTLLRALTPERRAARRKEIQAQKSEAAARFRPSEQRQVRLFDLAPGMRLAAPLISMDGEPILPAGVTIDVDILLRVFQLSAVRPMPEKVAVLR